MNFDLNIANYNKNELLDMFELPSNYDKNSVEMKELRLRENILNDKNIDNATRDLTINFLVKAKNLLIGKNDNGSDANKDEEQSVIKDGITDVTTALKNMEKVYENSKLRPIYLEDPQQHMVQKKSPTPYVLSYPTTTFPGILNPLKRITRKENIVIDTRFRENYYNSSPTNFNFQLPMVIENVIQMELAALELPTTHYLISKQYNNNFFTIGVNDEYKVVTIPDGNYDYNALETIVNSQVHLLGGLFQHINFVVNISIFNSNNISTNNGSGQMMVGVDTTGASLVRELELNFQADKYGYDDRNTPLPLKFGWLMGFRNGIYTENLNYVSESLVDISGSRYFYLVVDDFNNNNNNGLFYGAFNSSLLNKNIIARISLQSSNFNNLLQNGLNLVNDPREYFGPVNIRNFQIQLLDEYGRVVDLNYMDFSFCLSMTINYDI